MTLDKTTLTIVYLGLLLGLPLAGMVVAAKLAWRGILTTARRPGWRIWAYYLLNPFHTKSSGARDT